MSFSGTKISSESFFGRCRTYLCLGHTKILVVEQQFPLRIAGSIGSGSDGRRAEERRFWIAVFVFERCEEFF
jgi:hypothetical protein